MSVELIKKNFELSTFNKDFTDHLKKQRESEKQLDEERLKTLNQEIYNKRFTEMSMQELMSEWKDSIIGLMNDLLHGRFDVSILFSENRLFFIGCTIVISVIIFYLLSLLFTTNKSTSNDTNIKISLEMPKMDDKTIDRVRKIFSK
jgi:hypothetical protein